MIDLLCSLVHIEGHLTVCIIENSLYNNLCQEIMMWIHLFPAFVNRKCAFTLIGSFRILACFEQRCGNLTEFLVHFVDVELNGVEMHFAGIIDQLEIVEQTVHVALHFGVFVNLAVTEFLDGL